MPEVGCCVVNGKFLSHMITLGLLFNTHTKTAVSLYVLVSFFLCRLLNNRVRKLCIDIDLLKRVYIRLISDNVLEELKKVSSVMEAAKRIRVVYRNETLSFRTC